MRGLFRCFPPLLPVSAIPGGCRGVWAGCAWLKPHRGGFVCAVFRWLCDHGGDEPGLSIFEEILNG
jgi:hypothetical protein